jgi:hypothetical protein
MKIWESEDRERPIETYPGYLGLYFDGDFMPEKELEPFKNFDFRYYAVLLEEFGKKRPLLIAFGSTQHTIVLPSDSNWTVARILDELPTVRVCIDNGPPNAGPASGGMIIFFLADDTTDEELTASISALRKALDTDLAWLQEWQRER